MIVRTTLEEVLSKSLTEEQMKMLEALKNITPEPDNECPEITAEQFARFKKVSLKK